MKKISMLFILSLVAIFFNSCSSKSKKVSKNSNFIFSKSGKKINPYSKYKIQEFNFTKNIKYLEVIKYSVTQSSNNKKFILSSDLKFDKIFKIGKMVKNKKNRRNLLWLSKVILKKDYFWKKRVKETPLYYIFTSLRFIDNKNRIGAIQNKKDIKELLGDIDTKAELALWLYATEANSNNIINYKKIDQLYRVKYKEKNREKCLNIEYFKFYDKNGKSVKDKLIKSIPYRCTNNTSRIKE